MTQVYIGIGSNIERERHIVAALDQLQLLFGALAISPVYETAAVGFAGDPFLNLVVGVDTGQPVGLLARELRRIERDNGYAGGAAKFSARSLDLDLLVYGDICSVVDGVQLPRDDITEYAYVLWPLADLAGDARHPLTRIRYADLRATFAGGRVLCKVPFVWRGRDLSAA
jgi:2-amino-4-hydroxy-6-hydroxymethyldihydropteridine diphosphokinase